MMVTIFEQSHILNNSCFLSTAAGVFHSGLTLPNVCWILWPHWPVHALHRTPHHCSHYLSNWTVTV